MNHPLNGVPEIIAFSIAGTIYLQLANTLHASRFISCELLIEWLEVKRPLPVACSTRYSTYSVLLSF